MSAEDKAEVNMKKKEHEKLRWDAMSAEDKAEFNMKKYRARKVETECYVS